MPGFLQQFRVTVWLPAWIENVVSMDDVLHILQHTSNFDLCYCTALG